MARIIIGLTGVARSGKTTVAEHLAEHHYFYHDSFAAPLRAAVADILGISQFDLESAKEDPIDWLAGATPRKMMQTLGTEWGRDTIHPELWVRSLIRRIGTTRRNVVVSDVRFPNEAEALRSLGAVIIRVDRPGAVVGTHPSEALVAGIQADHTLYNVAELPQLRSVVDDLLYNLTKGRI